MEDITLEKVDMVRERTGVSYEKAKEALEICQGNVLDALVYIEQHQDINKDKKYYSQDEENEVEISIDKLKTFLKELIEKGNVTRIKIKKDDMELVDIPVNAGVAAGVIAIIIPQILAAAFIVAVATKITIEITKEDGSTEVINKYVSKVANDVKNKASDFADKLKNKVNEVKYDNKSNNENTNKSSYKSGETVYSYTVKFDDDNEEK